MKLGPPRMFSLSPLGYCRPYVSPPNGPPPPFHFAQEGCTDVPESRLAVSLFSFSLSVPGSPVLPRRSLYSALAFFVFFFCFFFLFFLRVGLQQEGHLQASSK